MVTTELSTRAREKMIAIYRHLHQNPELSMQEHKTQELIEPEVETIGLERLRGGGTGVVAIDRNGDGPTVALRADPGGLPIEEKAWAEYASSCTGEQNGTTVPVIHACGHEAHITAGLTAA